MEPTSELVAIGDYELQMHTWKPAAPSQQRPRAVAVVYHGFLVSSFRFVHC
jgi:hypothetical protein